MNRRKRQSMLCSCRMLASETVAHLHARLNSQSAFHSQELSKLVYGLRTGLSFSSVAQR